MANINIFTNASKMDELAYELTRAYLLQNNVALNRKGRPMVDRKWYFGNFSRLMAGGSWLIKTQDNSLFTFLVLRQISQDTNIALHTILLFLLFNRYESFPAEKIRIAQSINHAQIHFSLLLIECQNIDQFQYRQLYNAFHQEFSNMNIGELYEEMLDPNSRLVKLLKNTPISNKPGKNNEPYGKKAWELCEKIDKSTSCRG
ncbi:MAG: hypothetical protein JSS07_00710 [Proteobacteria bacterium]|nr:hypothetical protein [Pseudomonadota bacterium]